MTARFLVDGTFYLESRGIFVAFGEILNGSVERGQLVWMPEEFNAEVSAVESILHSASTGKAQPALVFQPNEDERARWAQLSLKGCVLELRDQCEPIPFPLGVGNVPWSDGKSRHPPARSGGFPPTSE